MENVILLPAGREFGYTRSMIVFNNTGNKKTLLFILQTLIGIHFPCLAGSIMGFGLLQIKLLSPQWYESPLF